MQVRFDSFFQKSNSFTMHVTVLEWKDIETTLLTLLFTQIVHLVYLQIHSHHQILIISLLYQTPDQMHDHAVG